MSDETTISILRDLLKEYKASTDDKIAGISKGLNLQMDAEFRVLNTRLTQQDVLLAKVETQTTKTNGRVTALELDESKHIVNCPVKEDLAKLSTKLDEKKADTEAQFKELNIDLREYRFFKKYPKIAIGILAVALIGIFLSSYLTLQKLGVQSKEIKENTSISIQNNKMLKVDSVKVDKEVKDIHVADSLLLIK